MASVYVAVGVIINKNNQVLIAKRASHQHQGGKWEFPGGKVEVGETSQQALYRELKEELGIKINSSFHLTDITHKYSDDKTDKIVYLNVYEIKSWSGEAEGREGQPILWVEKSDLTQYTFPAANAKILDKIIKK